jgi:hypothetical protein
LSRACAALPTQASATRAAAASGWDGFSFMGLLLGRRDFRPTQPI